MVCQTGPLCFPTKNPCCLGNKISMVLWAGGKSTAQTKPGLLWGLICPFPRSSSESWYWERTCKIACNDVWFTAISHKSWVYLQVRPFQRIWVRSHTGEVLQKIVLSTSGSPIWQAEILWNFYKWRSKGQSFANKVFFPCYVCLPEGILSAFPKWKSFEDDFPRFSFVYISLALHDCDPPEIGQLSKREGLVASAGK